MTSIRLLRTFDAHPSAITCLAYSPDGATLACGYKDGGVVSWDVATGALRTTYAEHATSYTDPILSIVYSPDGALLASSNMGYYPACRERAVHVWRTSASTLAYKVGGFRYWIHAMAFSSDGALLAVGGDDRLVKLYDAQLGHEHGSALPRLPYSVSSLAFSPDCRLLAAGCDGSQIKLWDLATRYEWRTIAGHGEWTYAIAFHPSGATFASGGEDGGISLWDTAIAQRLCDVKGYIISPGEWGDGAVFSLAFNSQGTLLASASADQTVELWSSATGERVSVAHHGGVRSVVFSPDGTFLASGGDHSVKLWQVDQ